MTSSPSIVVAETYAQGTSRVRSFEHGSLLRILPSTITLRVTANTTAQQSGLLGVTLSMSGRKMVRCCGFMAIVCSFRLQVVSLS